MSERGSAGGQLLDAKSIGCMYIFLQVDGMCYERFNWFGLTRKKTKMDAILE